MESENVKELTAQMRDVSLYMSEMVKVLRGIGISLDALTGTVNSLDYTLADIRNLLLDR